MVCYWVRVSESQWHTPTQKDPESPWEFVLEWDGYYCINIVCCTVATCQFFLFIFDNFLRAFTLLVNQRMTSMKGGIVKFYFAVQLLKFSGQFIFLTTFLVFLSFLCSLWLRTQTSFRWVKLRSSSVLAR